MSYATKSRLRSFLHRKLKLEVEWEELRLEPDRVQVLTADIVGPKGPKSSKPVYRVCPRIKFLDLQAPVTIFIAPEFLACGSVQQDHFHLVPGLVPEHLQLPVFLYQPRGESPKRLPEAILERSPAAFFVIQDSIAGYLAAQS